MANTFIVAYQHFNVLKHSDFGWDGICDHSQVYMRWSLCIGPNSLRRPRRQTSVVGRWSMVEFRCVETRVARWR